MISHIEDFFDKGCGRCARFATADCSVRRWDAGLRALRALCQSVGLAETVKWGHPCYRYAGRNVAIIGAFRDDFRLSFFDAGLLDDPDRVLERQGPNTRHADCLRFRDAAAVQARRDTILSFLKQAMDHAAAGRRTPPDETGLDLPETLMHALDADLDLAEAFHRLTPGRQRSHALHVAAARLKATQENRIAALRPRILAGKGANER